MEDLNAAIGEVEKWSGDRSGDRDTVVSALNNTVGSLKDAIAVWKDFLASPPQSAEGEMATMNMVGGDRAKKLYSLGQDTIANKRTIFKLVGGEVEYYSGLQDPLVVEAYLQLKTGETVTDRANDAIETMEKRISEIEDLAKRAAA